MPNDSDAERILWAQENINTLMQQRAGLDRRINEFRAFIAMLEESDAAIHGRNGNGQHASLADMVVDILRGHRGVPMSPAQVADEVQRRGFKPQGKVKLRDLVGIELPRQARAGRGVIRVSAGLYAVPAEPPE